TVSRGLPRSTRIPEPSVCMTGGIYHHLSFNVIQLFRFRPAVETIRVARESSVVYQRRMIPMTMRAARFYDQQDIRIEDIDRPIPGPDDVLIDIAWCGICGTDIHEYQDGPIFIPPKGSPHPVTGEE